MRKMINYEMMKMKNAVKILRLTPPMWFSALKPGPVVPPGIEKVPNQAARKTQSVDFTHLSDILAFFRGVTFWHFFVTFSCFHFLTFWWFWFSCFCHFLCFVDFCVFTLFVFCWFLSIFVDFYLLTSIFDHFCV